MAGAQAFVPALPDRCTSLVVRVLAIPVSTFLIATIAPGMAAPDASCTTPEMVPVDTWEKTRPPKITPISSTGKYRDMSIPFRETPRLQKQRTVTHQRPLRGERWSPGGSIDLSIGKCN